VTLIDKYIKNKEEVLKKVGEGNVMSPFAISKIIDVPFRDINDMDELEELEKLAGIEDDFDDLRIDRETFISEMEEYEPSNLLFIYYFRPKMNYFFVMDNNKAFRVQASSLKLAGKSMCITENLLSVFEKFKIEELKDRMSWVPIKSRFELLDFD